MVKINWSAHYYNIGGGVAHFSFVYLLGFKTETRWLCPVHPPMLWQTIINSVSQQTNRDIPPSFIHRSFSAVRMAPNSSDAAGPAIGGASARPKANSGSVSIVFTDSPTKTSTNYGSICPTSTTSQCMLGTRGLGLTIRRRITGYTLANTMESQVSLSKIWEYGNKCGAVEMINH